jgi:hypothetical protein
MNPATLSRRVRDVPIAFTSQATDDPHQRSSAGQMNPFGQNRIPIQRSLLALLRFNNRDSSTQFSLPGFLSRSAWRVSHVLARRGRDARFAQVGVDLQSQNPRSPSSSRRRPRAATALTQMESELCGIGTSLGQQYSESCTLQAKARRSRYRLGRRSNFWLKIWRFRSMSSRYRHACRVFPLASFVVIACDELAEPVVHWLGGMIPRSRERFTSKAGLHGHLQLSIASESKIKEIWHARHVRISFRWRYRMVNSACTIWRNAEYARFWPMRLALLRVFPISSISSENTWPVPERASRDLIQRLDTPADTICPCQLMR